MFAYRAARRLVSGLAVLTLVGGCATGTSPSPVIGPSGPAPTDPVLTYVRAQVACSVTSRTSRTEGANEIYVEHFSCTYDATDPRLDGRVEGDVTATFDPAAAAAAQWEGDFTDARASKRDRPLSPSVPAPEGSFRPAPRRGP